MKIIMTTLFGIEAITARELVDLGYSESQISVSDGQVALDAGVSREDLAQAVARCNMFLRTAERVLLQVACFQANQFDQLFDETALLPWEEWLPRKAEILVKGYSRKSALFGISACQSLIKKAIIKRLVKHYGLEADARIEEDRSQGQIKIQFGIVNDQVSMMIDTSGDGLHKRGYRPLQHEAPIKETLAAAMLKISRFRPGSDEALIDPCCGSGTILIEAAMLAARLAPGMNREFSAENWPYIGIRVFDQARDEAFDVIADKQQPELQIFGSDISSQAVDITRNNARRAGVSQLISVKTADLTKFQTADLSQWTGYQKHLILCNPPYGERLMDTKQAEALIASLARLGLDHGRAKPDCRLSVISPEDAFERIAGGKADKRRKLYNGMIKCTLYQYFKHKNTSI